MADAPWLTILGLGEDGPEGLCLASRRALTGAQVVMGPPRHLTLLPGLDAELVEWPVPFAEGLPKLGAFQGRRVVVLASGDPFWFGVGSVIARRFAPGEWRALPGPSTFALAAARLGWPLEQTLCLGLHAAPLARLRPYLTDGARLIVLLRDGEAVSSLAAYLAHHGCAASGMTVMEALGGPRERVRAISAANLPADIAHPVCVAITVSGPPGLPLTSGRPDDLFDHDGQITKSPIRALTLTALAPRAGERLWDIGGGSGSVAIEWLLSHPATRAISVEPNATRAVRIKRNAQTLGVDRLQVVTGAAPEALDGLDAPDAVFIGGGMSEMLLTRLWDILPSGTRLVANAVTLESGALLAHWHAAKGGDLLRIDLARAAPVGPRRGWKAAFPVVQWSVAL